MSSRGRGYRGNRGGRGGGRVGSQPPRGGGRGDGQPPSGGEDGWDLMSGTLRETPNPIQSELPIRSRGGLDPTSSVRRGPRGNPNSTHNQSPTISRSRDGLNQASYTQRGTLNFPQNSGAHAPSSGGTRDGGGNVLGNDEYTPGSQIFQ